METDCNYCLQPGMDRGDNIHICSSCWNLLRDPKTALPLIRGTLTMKLRGRVPKEKLDSMINDFMGMISTWKRPG